MQDNQPRFTLRISKVLLDKIGYIAEYEGRTKNKEIEQIIRTRVEDFENSHGVIKPNTKYSND